MWLSSHGDKKIIIKSQIMKAVYKTSQRVLIEATMRPGSVQLLCLLFLLEMDTHTHLCLGVFLRIKSVCISTICVSQTYCVHIYWTYLQIPVKKNNSNAIVQIVQEK